MEIQDRILVVDDDESLCLSIVNVLQNKGYLIDYAKNGIEAEVKINKNTYNLFLIDIKLPDTNGIELLLKINKKAPKAKKIMLTGFPEAETAINAVNEKANAYLVKPFDTEKLIKVIEENLYQQKEELNYTQEKVFEYIQKRVKELDQRS